MLAADRTIEQLQRRVMRAGKIIDSDRHTGEIARRLQRRIECQDRLRRDRRAKRGDFRAADFAAFDAVDAAPFADIIRVRLAFFEQRLL